MDKTPLPPGIRTDRTTPRLIAAVLAFSAVVYCVWATVALARRPHPRPERYEAPQRTPEELSETTLVRLVDR